MQQSHSNPARKLIVDFLFKSSLCHLLNINVITNDLLKQGPVSDWKTK